MPIDRKTLEAFLKEIEYVNKDWRPPTLAILSCGTCSMQLPSPEYMLPGDQSMATAAKRKIENYFSRAVRACKLRDYSEFDFPARIHLDLYNGNPPWRQQPQPDVIVADTSESSSS